VEPTREQAYQRRIAELEAQIAELKAEVARLSKQVAKLSKNSSNSSKPPSSDIVKPPKPAAGPRKNKIGGQPGHTGAQARGQGFLNVVGRYPDIEVVDDQPANWNVSTAASLTEAVLNRHPDLRAVFADNDDMALAARQVIDNAGLGDQVLVGGVDAMPSALEAVADGRLLATTRNPSTRIHGWSVVAGAFAATVGVDAAREQIPFFVLADGPLVTAEVDTNPAFNDAPWKRINYGFSSIAGQLWLEEQFLF